MHRKNLNICFVTEDFYPSFIGGQGVWGNELVSRLANWGARVTVFAERRGERDTYWKSRSETQVTLVPYCFGNQLVLGFIEYIYFIVRFRTRRFDILHANQLTALFFLLFRPKNISRIVVSVHNTWDQIAAHTSPIKRWIYTPLIAFESFIYRRADGLLFHTESEKQYAMKRYTLIHKPSAVAPIGAREVQRSTPAERTRLRKRLGVPQDAQVVLYIGRLVRRKHVDTIVRALELLYKRHKKIVGMIIGKGPDQKRLQSMSPPNVVFYGFIGDADPYFQIADVFVLPSVAEGGVAIAAFEAASYGLPLLLSPDATDPHILADKENGYIIDPTDARALSGKILDALQNKKVFNPVSRQKARRFSWEITASATLSFYRRLLGKDVHKRA